ATGNHLLWTRARLAAVAGIAADASAQGLAVDGLIQPREVLATGPHDPAVMAAADVSLTNTLLGLAQSISGGLLERQALGPDWSIPPRAFDAPAMLTGAVNTDTLRSAFRALAPQDPQYAALTKAVVAYRAIEAHGGWPLLSRADDPALPERLSAEGYDAKDSVPRALAMFQGTH